VANQIRSRLGLKAILALSAAGALILSGCSGGTDDGDGSNDGDGNRATEFSVLITAENSAGADMLERLAEGPCADANAALPYTLDQTPSAQMQQKILLLAGQDALPVMFAAGQQFIYKDGQLAAAGQVLDVKATLTDLGVFDLITPAAQSVVDQLYDGEFPSLPLQFNTEGIFYNKDLFAQNGIDVPETVDELLEAARTLKAAGLTPIVASGKTGWSISRWVGEFIFRDLGADAMMRVRDGQAKLTDPEYVRAAQRLQDMGLEGLFINGITNVDMDTALNQLFTGQAAMMYNLTNTLQRINDPAVNTQNLGFFPFPAITGGKGSIDDLPANVGSPNVLSNKLYGPNVGLWLKCMAENYGSVSMESQGVYSGFKINTPVANVAPLTAEIQERIDNATSTVLWFEALFNQKATTDASNNAAPLLTGAMSAEEYMTVLQADLEEG
jgi:raffinose/stachyose/melibiose transport system substrate-binding protein